MCFHYLPYILGIIHMLGQALGVERGGFSSREKVLREVGTGFLCKGLVEGGERFGNGKRFEDAERSAQIAWGAEVRQATDELFLEGFP